MQKSGIGVRWGNLVVQADGDGRVESAVIGPVDGGPSERVEVDTVCLGHGFTPAVQLSRLAGCKHRYHSGQRTFVPVRDKSLQTTSQL